MSTYCNGTQFTMTVYLHQVRDSDGTEKRITRRQVLIKTAKIEIGSMGRLNTPDEAGWEKNEEEKSRKHWHRKGGKESKQTQKELSWDGTDQVQRLVRSQTSQVTPRPSRWRGAVNCKSDITIPDWKEGAFFFFTPCPCAILCRVEDPEYYNSIVHFLYCMTSDMDYLFSWLLFYYNFGIFDVCAGFRLSFHPCHVTLPI